MGHRRNLGKSISSLVFAHKNQPAVILGGAPSLLEDLKVVPTEAVFISTNDHGCRVRKCHYAACCDDVEARMTKWEVPLITRNTWADYRVFDKPLPNSGLLGAWAAWVMGCAPIILAGVECYTGKTYFDDPKAHSSGYNLSLNEHLKRWSRLKSYAPGGHFRAVSGPLLALFPLYTATELHQVLYSEEEVRRTARGTRVLFLKGEVIHNQRYARDEIGEFTDLEAHMLIRRNIAVRAQNG